LSHEKKKKKETGYFFPGRWKKALLLVTRVSKEKTSVKKKRKSPPERLSIIRKKKKGMGMDQASAKPTDSGGFGGKTHLCLRGFEKKGTPLLSLRMRRESTSLELITPQLLLGATLNCKKKGGRSPPFK